MMRRQTAKVFRLGRIYGFTMLEIMIVLGIAGLLIAMAVPFIGGIFNEHPMRDTTRSAMSLLEQARAQAIMTGQPYEFVVRPADYVMHIRPAAHRAPGNGGELSIDSLGAAPAALQTPGPAPVPKPPEKQSPFAKLPTSANIHPDIVIEMVAVNYVDKKDLPEASVRFYPNGTSDKFTFVYNRGPQEYRLIRLDMMTALANFETDPSKFLDSQD